MAESNATLPPVSSLAWKRSQAFSIFQCLFKIWRESWNIHCNNIDQQYSAHTCKTFTSTVQTFKSSLWFWFFTWKLFSYILSLSCMKSWRGKRHLVKVSYCCKNMKFQEMPLGSRCSKSLTIFINASNPIRRLRQKSSY